VTDAPARPASSSPAGVPDTIAVVRGRPRLLDESGVVLEDVSRADVEQRLRDGHVFWLDLPAVGSEVVMWLRDVFKFHPLAVDDAVHFGERPKLEEYDGYVMLVIYGSGAEAVDARARPVEELADWNGPGLDQVATGDIAPHEMEALSEIHFFLAENYLVTVHQADCPPFRHMLARAHARKVPVTDVSRVFYRVADTLVDSFFPILASLDDRIDVLQALVIERPDNAQLGELLLYRSSLISLRKVITPQRDLFASLSSQVAELPGFDQDEIRYLRDIYDHLIRLSDMVDGYRDLLSGTTDAYLSVVSNQLNVVMKQLAIISTVFLPLAFITGFFGQNFGWMVGHIGSWKVFVALGLGTELVAVVLLMMLFRRRGWIGTKT
jgi:magnesium transporter